MSSRVPALLFVFAVVLLALPSTAWAYLDAGTGSMILQVLLAGVAGLAVFGKLLWRRIKALLKGKERAENGVARDEHQAGGDAKA